MSTGTTDAAADADAPASVGVGVELTGVLVVRTGMRRSQMSLAAGATVADVVDRLAERRGPQVRRALLKGDRLRQGVVATVRSSEGHERASADTPLAHGDRVRFEFAD